MPTKSPRILSFDIESAGVNALNADLGFVIVFGYKWAHERRAHTLVIDRAGLRRFDDRRLLVRASKLLTHADILVGHFASVFDRRFIQGRLLIHRLPSIPQTKLRDTCMIARSVANYSSNRLKHLAKILKLRHQKLENNWPNAWFDVMKGNRRVLAGMARYCRGDVLAVEELYFRLRPFDNAHPRIVNDRRRCSTCGGTLQYRGISFAAQRRFRRTQCTACGKWGQETRPIPYDDESH